jgi:hypothetical protein
MRAAEAAGIAPVHVDAWRSRKSPQFGDRLHALAIDPLRDAGAVATSQSREPGLDAEGDLAAIAREAPPPIGPASRTSVDRPAIAVSRAAASPV